MEAADIPDGNKAIEYIFLIQFHHSRGPEVEFCYPPLSESDKAHLPDLWAFLPFYALPEGAHHIDEDLIFFHLPCIEHDGETLFGVACYKQIAAESVANKQADVTRSFMQKSVVVLSRQPMYGIMATKLHAVCNSLFAQKDFSSVSVLEECFDQVNSTIKPGSPDQVVMGIGLRSLVRKFRFQLLILVKAMLLERRTLCTGWPVRLLSGGSLAVASLVPGLLQSGLRGVWGLSASAYPASADEELAENDADEYDRLRRTGFPLIPFTQDCVFLPYVPLQCLELLMNARSYWAGATNALFQMKAPHDVFVNFTAGTVEVRNALLAEQLSLTTQDLRFMERIIKAVEADWSPDGEDGSQFVGSDAWVRVQFQDYLLRMCGQYLRYVSDEGPAVVNACRDFGQPFVDAWAQTENYANWKKGVDPEIRAEIPEGHPCSGEFTIQDVRLRINSKVQAALNEEQRTELSKGKQEASEAVAEVSQQLAQAFSQAKVGFSSWFSKKKQEFETLSSQHIEHAPLGDSATAPPKPPPPSDEALKKRAAAQEADRLPASSVARAASPDNELREAAFTNPPSEPTPLEAVETAPGSEAKVSQSALLPSDDEDDAEDLQAA